jgi:hypothetical protein
MNQNIHAKWLQPETWQRVVDGQLACAELQELVTTCERHPELWKCCAVAFLEEQAIALELQQLARQWPATPATAPPEVARIKAAPQSVAAASSASQPPRRASQLAWLNHLALAASVGLAFVVGWKSAQHSSGRSNAPAAAEANSVTIGGDSAEAAQASQLIASTDSRGEKIVDPLLDELLEAAADEAGAVELAVQRPEQFVPLDRRIPKPLAELERRGLVRIKSTEGFVPVRMRDGNTAVVPVQQIELRPARNAY